MPFTSASATIVFKVSLLIANIAFVMFVHSPLVFLYTYHISMLTTSQPLSKKNYLSLSNSLLSRSFSSCRR
ncbi:hypothetical protein BSP15_218 [Bacillus phage BSP15]|nr:hypothetical protein BSP15_218 [Bacillus phage BSP15]